MSTGDTISGFPMHWQEDSGEWIKIKEFKIKQPVSEFPGFIVKLGEEFWYNLQLEFTAFLGAAGNGLDIKIGIYAMDLSTGSVQATYSTLPNVLDRDLKDPRVSATEKHWDDSDAAFKFTASVEGTFLLTTVVTCPSTGIAAFSTGPLLQVFPI